MVRLDQLLNFLFKIHPYFNFALYNFTNFINLIMLLETNQKLDDLIVEKLSRKTSLTADLLHDQLLEGGKEFTIQALYKTLRRLEEAGVVVKNKKKYSLRLSWVADLADLAKSASINYLKSAKASLPKKGRRIIWHFSNLLALNNFWSQVLLLLIQYSDQKKLLTWMPHPWYHLVYSEQEEQYIRSLTLTDTQLYLINGGTTFLDHWAERYWQSENIEYSSAQSVFSKEESNIYLNIIDDYVLRVKLDDKITAEIEKLFQSTKSMDDVEFSELFRVFGQKVQANMWLENNPEKAAAYSKKFKNFFGKIK